MKAITRKWSDDEIATIRRLYPDVGAMETAAALPNRTVAQVQSAARRFKLIYIGPRLGGTPPKEELPWAVPAHEYTAEDIAFRQWPALSVGIMSPSVGLVVGRAA